MDNKNTTALTQANAAMRSKDYNKARLIYEKVILNMTGTLKSTILFNLNLIQKKTSLNPCDNTHTLVKPAYLSPYDFEIIVEGNYFDPQWYRDKYNHLPSVTNDPLGHYLREGIQLSTNPSPDFDTAYYIKTHKDVADSGMHPFLHYVRQGHKEKRSVKPTGSGEGLDQYLVDLSQYVPRLGLDAAPIEKAARVVAFYLPQFHPIPENDAWWGKGFTEWTNVKPAQPQFEGHYQPHIPDDFLGYYDLRETGVMRKQIQLAKQYGIEGFCFYTYWFSGRRLLETPVDNYIADPSLELPFCICWANENWSRRWDGLDQDLLMVQHYSHEDDLAFIAQMSKYLCDRRYIRVAGKPLLIVYRPNLFPSMKDTAARWRDWCRSNGLGEIYIAYVQSFEKRDPSDYGLDAAIEFPPNNSSPPDITAKAPAVSTDFEGKIYDWRIFLKRSECYKAPDYRVFRAVCPSWDNTARKKKRSTVFANSSPKLFKHWLVSAFEEIRHRSPMPDQQLVFVNAWNEWAEGAHLEPDQRYGYAWLQAVRDAHSAALTVQPRILVVSHDAHPHGAQYLILEVARFLKSIGYEVVLLLLDGGKLLPDFEQIGRVLNAKVEEETTVRNFLNRFHARGASEAITSTVVSGAAVPLLKTSGYRVISLIHELPGVIQQMKQEENARTRLHSR